MMDFYKFYPKNCPECGDLLEHDDNLCYCINYECPFEIFMVKVELYYYDPSDFQRVKADKQDEIADDVDARLMKKTTQESPEWTGGCNCSTMRVVPAM
jgi:hypothetical protein